MKKIVFFAITLLATLVIISACKKDNPTPNENNNTENPGEDSSSDNPNYPSTAIVISNAVTDYDGNKYDAVKIGNQVWMAKNLRTKHYADGTPIPAGASGMINFRFAPNNNEDNVPEYGYLYSWEVAMNYANSSNSNPSGVQGVCPNGWHLPSEAEWTQLQTYMGSQSTYHPDGHSDYIAKALAATWGWNQGYNTYAVGNDQSANNASGFSALPAGACNLGVCIGFGEHADFWSSTSYPDLDNYAYFLNIHCYNERAALGNGNKSIANSVRCVRD